MKTCDDCFEDFEPKHGHQTECETCKPYDEYDKDKCVDLWKIFQSRGFNNQMEIDRYQMVKKSYLNHTGKKLPKMYEKVNKKAK